MLANRLPLAPIGQIANNASISAQQQMPRLTYSSVIHSLVEQLTQRSPFLLEADLDSTGEAEVALLYREEVRTGEFLGQGNFSNVFEVADLRLRPPPSPPTDDEVRAPGIGRDSEGNDPDLDKEDAETDAARQRRMQLRFNLFRADGTCSYAVKCLRPELLENPSPKVFLEAATDLVMEAKYLCKLNHENILKVKGLAQGWESAFANGEYDSFFILLDRLEETLNKRIKRWRRGEFPDENTIEFKLPCARQLASALSYLADRQILFRDCKPQNIGLRRNADDSLSVCLFDFGFCRQLPIIEQARDDEEDSAIKFGASALPSGEIVYMMSGKGTRRYMAPEVLLKNQYNLKADVYSWAMVCWELMTLHKPFYKYTKDQHALLVCERGERPPLESSISPLWPSTSFHSLSISLSSIPSNYSCDESHINFSQVMTDPIRDLLTQAWHHDVGQRCSMRQVVDALDGILHSSVEATDGTTRKAPSDLSNSSLSNSSTPSRRFSCLASEYGNVREIVAHFANDLPNLPFLTCLGLDSFKHMENVDPETTNTVLPKSPELLKFKQSTSHVPVPVPVVPVQEKDEREEDSDQAAPPQFVNPWLQTLLVQ